MRIRLYQQIRSYNNYANFRVDIWTYLEVHFRVQPAEVVLFLYTA